jgi:hypothetical protein
MRFLRQLLGPKRLYRQTNPGVRNEVIHHCIINSLSTKILLVGLQTIPIWCEGFDSPSAYYFVIIA